MNEVCPEGIQPCNMKNRDVYWRRYKKQCTQDNDTSVLFKVGTLDLIQFSQSPSAAALYFPESHQWSEISYLSKVLLVLRKARSCRVPNLGCRGLSHLGDFMFHQKTLHNTWYVSGHVVVMKLPVAHSCSLLNHPNSFHGGAFKLNAKFDADSLFYSVIFNATATQYTRSLNGVYRPPVTSAVKSSLFTHAPSSPLSLAARLRWCGSNHSLHIYNG